MTSQILHHTPSEDDVPSEDGVICFGAVFLTGEGRRTEVVPATPLSAHEGVLELDDGVSYNLFLRRMGLSSQILRLLHKRCPGCT